MNKALHVLVYIFLALACTALWFEMQLNAKRRLLTDRNRLQEDYLVRIARTIEKEDPAKDTVVELHKDTSPVEAKLVDTPDTQDLLSDYNAYLEKANLETYNWENTKDRDQLRHVYIFKRDENGMETNEPEMDGTQPRMKGPGTEDEMLNMLLESSKSMQSRLNSTRAELVKVREILEAQVDELNKLKPEARQDKVTIEEKKAKIASLEDEKANLEDQIVKIKAEIEQLNAEIASLKDEVQSEKDKFEEKKEELEKAKKLIENLKQMLKEQMERARNEGGTTASRGTAVTSLPTGDKGKLVKVDNERMFAIVNFSAETMKELKGEQLDHPLPALELSVKRGDRFVGRLRLRQEVKGQTLVICDILGAWAQDELKIDDVVFAD